MPDPQGVVGECLHFLPYEAKGELHESLNKRASHNNWSEQGEDEDRAAWHDNWKYVDCVLVPKSAGYQPIADAFDFRPIALLCVFLKLYMRCLMTLMTPFLAIWGFIQYGARAYPRCIEVIMIVRLIFEKSQ